MTRSQINKLNMYEAVLQLLNTNTTVWSANAAASATVAAFAGYVTSINDNDAAQKTRSTGITQTKTNAQMTMALAAVAVANAGRAYANATGNAVLFDAMKHTKTEIMEASDTDADDICQNIHDAINPYIANTAAYGARAATLTNLQNLINAYSALVGKPALQKSIKRNATISLTQLFTAASALLKNQLDPLMMQYKTSMADFYRQYVFVRLINDIGHRHRVAMVEQPMAV